MFVCVNVIRSEGRKPVGTSVIVVRYLIAVVAHGGGQPQEGGAGVRVRIDLLFRCVGEKGRDDVKVTQICRLNMMG